MSRRDAGANRNRIDALKSRGKSVTVSTSRAWTCTLSTRKLRDCCLIKILWQQQGTRLNILGLSGLAHDSAAALLSDDGILAAMEESKLVRRRTAAGIPREAIRFCLERAGTGWGGVECVAVASRPVRAWVRQAWMRAKLTPFAPVPSGYYQTKALGELGRELNNGRLLEMLGESPNLQSPAPRTSSLPRRKRFLRVRCRPRLGAHA